MVCFKWYLAIFSGDKEIDTPDFLINEDNSRSFKTECNGKDYCSDVKLGLSITSIIFLPLLIWPLLMPCHYHLSLRFQFWCD